MTSLHFWSHLVSPFPGEPSSVPSAAVQCGTRTEELHLRRDPVPRDLLPEGRQRHPIHQDAHWPGHCPRHQGRQGSRPPAGHWWGDHHSGWVLSTAGNNNGADSRFAPSQWEMAFLCNNISHWLGASLEQPLNNWLGGVRWQPLCGWEWVGGEMGWVIEWDTLMALEFKELQEFWRMLKVGKSLDWRKFYLIWIFPSKFKHEIVKNKNPIFHLIDEEYGGQFRM